MFELGEAICRAGAASRKPSDGGGWVPCVGSAKSADLPKTCGLHSQFRSEQFDSGEPKPPNDGGPPSDGARFACLQFRCS